MATPKTKNTKVGAGVQAALCALGRDVPRFAVENWLLTYKGPQTDYDSLAELYINGDAADDNAPMTGSFPTVTEKTHRELVAAGFHPRLAWTKGLSERMYTTSEVKRAIAALQKRADQGKPPRKKAVRNGPSGGGTRGNAANPYKPTKTEE